MAPIQSGAVWVYDFFCFVQIPSTPTLRAARSDPRKPKLEPKGRQEGHKRSSTAARSMAPMAPIQIGAAWVHNFVCFP